jgi:hypothetical protein
MLAPAMMVPGLWESIAGAHSAAQGTGGKEVWRGSVLLSEELVTAHGCGRSDALLFDGQALSGADAPSGACPELFPPDKK